MNTDNLWLSGLPEEQKEQFDNFRRYLETVHDGSMDLNTLLSSLYGAELARRLAVRCKIQQDTETAEAYYHSVGLTFEFHYPEDYYRRWKLFVPRDFSADHQYPVVIWNHGGGNSIESEEPMTGYLQLAGRKKFLLIMAQNTNPENILRILDDVCKRYPVDNSRVYVAGFSQGSNQGHGLYTHHSDRITAAALTCIDIWRPWDNFDEYYTDEELEQLKKSTVPLSLQVGACEPFAYAPLNHWRKSKMNPKAPALRGRPDDFEHPGKDDAMDPTRITAPGKGRIDSFNPDIPRMTSSYIPSDQDDVNEWSLRRVNLRLDLLGCAPLNTEKCIGYFYHTEDSFHHRVGIYGDEEETISLYGICHDIVRIRNKKGHMVFQYVVTENSPHWPPLTSADIGWSFLKRFRKDERGQCVFSD